MRYEMEDKDKDYLSLYHEKSCDLLPITEEIYNRKIAADQIIILAAQKVVQVDYRHNNNPRVPFKKKARTGVLPSRKNQGKNTPNNKGYQSYCVIFDTFGIPERKYKSNSSEK